MLKISNRIDLRDRIAEMMVCDVKIDLHIHTFYSDGELSPVEVIDKRMAEGYKLISITDHDEIDGTIYGARYAQDVGIDCITGIELDSADQEAKDLHILGYGIDPANPSLSEALNEIRMRRDARNNLMQEALQDMGYEITKEELQAVNQGRYIGKPTFAKVIMDKYQTASISEVFETIFCDNSIKSISKSVLPTELVIDIIHKAGGLAIMAHPMEQRRYGESLNEFLARLSRLLDRMRSYGIDGIECRHPSAGPDQVTYLQDYSEKYSLLTTQGSDFHSDKLKRNFERYYKN